MLTLDDVKLAAERIHGLARRTPLLYSETFTHLLGAPVYLKTENLQRTGSFKVRGAANRLAQLTADEAKRGVITASAGNHAQGVALAARHHRVPCTVVMPETGSLAKYEATLGYGATVIRCGTSYDDALARARDLAAEQGLVYIPAFDDSAVVAGQGTIGLEILEDLPDAGLILVPVGGGGLLAGIAVAAKAIKPDIALMGVQSAAADAAGRSFRAGRLVTRHPDATIADGIAVGRPGHIPMALIRKHVEGVATVDDEAIARAVVLLLERSKLLVEPAGAAGLAAALSGTVALDGRKTVLVLSGGNLDIALLARIVEHGLSASGRYLMLRATLTDRPGELARLLGQLGDLRANVVQVEHHRTGLGLGVGQAEVELTVEVHDRQHAREIMQALTGAGWAAVQITGRRRTHTSSRVHDEK